MSLFALSFKSIIKVKPWERIGLDQITCNGSRLGLPSAYRSTSTLCFFGGGWGGAGEDSEGIQNFTVGFSHKTKGYLLLTPTSRNE